MIVSLHNDIQKLKTKNEEAIDLAKQAMANSNEAQTLAEEAKVITNNNTHKINKMEQNIKTIETIQKEINNYKNKTTEEMKDMKNNVDANTKKITATNNQNKRHILYTRHHN